MCKVVEVIPDKPEKAEENAADIVADAIQKKKVELTAAQAVVDKEKNKRAEACLAELAELQKKYNCAIKPHLVMQNGQVVESGLVVIPK